MRPISGGVVGGVEPAETQPFFDGAQLRQPVPYSVAKAVALGAVLVRARRCSSPDDGQLVFGAIAQLVEPRVEIVDVVLLVLKFGRRFAHRTPFSTPARRIRAASTLLRGLTG